MIAAHRVVCFALLCAALYGCAREVPSAAANGDKPVPARAASASSRQAVVLRMRIDDSEWVATHDVFAAVHPAGYDRAIVVAGSLGKQARHEQAFTLNLFGVDKPGRYAISSRQIALGVIQFGDFSVSRYLIGGALGYEATVEVTALNASPLRVEARFEGVLIANDGTKVSIRDGYFTYSE